ncbi:MAG: hypothetical protein COA78_21600 [Blastopirellula sp.]|nr:MAG: hypothetical protein COA78_21600 [Blastopirellula sp.]
MNSYRYHRLLLSWIWLVLLTDSTFAVDQIRTWSDQSGNFQIEAELLKYKNGTVYLLKTDTKAIKIPAASLSEADQEYLKEEGGLFSSNPLDFDISKVEKLDLLTRGLELEELPSDGPVMITQEERDIPSLEPDIPADFPSFQPFGLVLGEFKRNPTFSRPVLIDPAHSTYAVSTYEEYNSLSGPGMGQICLVRPGVTTPKLVVNSGSAIKLVDHHISSGRSLAISGLDTTHQRGSVLVMLENLATGSPKIIALWHVPNYNNPGSKPRIHFAKMIDDESVCVRINDNIYAWNLLRGELLFKIEDASLGYDPKNSVSLSANQKYLGIGVKGGCLLIDVTHRELLGKIGFWDSLTPQVHFSPRGDQIALSNGEFYKVWSFKTGNSSYFGAIGSSQGSFYGWVGDNLLLTSHGLYDIKLGMNSWRYIVGPTPNVIAVPGGILLVESHGATKTLAGFPIPHASLKRMNEQLSNGDDNTMIVHPGTEVMIEVSTVEGVDTDLIKESIGFACTKAGWQVVDNSPIKLLVTISKGKEQELHFRRNGQSVGANELKETLQLSPFAFKIKMTNGENRIWYSGLKNTIPMPLVLSKDETLQEAVNRFESIDPDFFARLEFPPRILRTDRRKSMGISRPKNGIWADTNY